MRGLPVLGIQQKEPDRLEIPGWCVYHLFGMDRPADADKVQGWQGGALWIEEPCPAADVSSGISSDVLLAATSLRQPGVKPRVQITMNPGDTQHWVYTKLLDRAEESGLSVAYFKIPPGENPHLPPGYRESNRAFLEAMGRQDLIRRLVEGERGDVQLGQPVTPDFSRALHLAPSKLPVIPGKGLRFWDGGHNATCIWAQIVPSGYLAIHGCVVGVQQGVEQLIQSLVLPIQQERFRAVRQWDDIGDPSMWYGDQSSVDTSPGLVIQQQLGGYLQPHPTDTARTNLFMAWPPRKDAIQRALRLTAFGHGWVWISKDALTDPLVQALSGKWRYHVTSSGEIVHPTPLKNMHSHPGDALSVGCLHLLGEGMRVRKAPAIGQVGVGIGQAAGTPRPYGGRSLWR